MHYSSCFHSTFRLIFLIKYLSDSTMSTETSGASASTNTSGPTQEKIRTLSFNQDCTYDSDLTDRENR